MQDRASSSWNLSSSLLYSIHISGWCKAKRSAKLFGSGAGLRFPIRAPMFDVHFILCNKSTSSYPCRLKKQSLKIAGGNIHGSGEVIQWEGPVSVPKALTYILMSQAKRFHLFDSLCRQYSKCTFPKYAVNAPEGCQHVMHRQRS